MNSALMVSDSFRPKQLLPRELFQRLNGFNVQIVDQRKVQLLLKTGVLLMLFFNKELQLSEAGSKCKLKITTSCNV